LTGVTAGTVATRTAWIQFKATSGAIPTTDSDSIIVDKMPPSVESVMASTGYTCTSGGNKYYSGIIPFIGSIVRDGSGAGINTSTCYYYFHTQGRLTSYGLS
jgi:hypothetical protein